MEDGSFRTYIYFKNSTTADTFSIKGYEIKAKDTPYSLHGTDSIFIKNFDPINRETLKSRHLVCSVVNSRQEIIKKLQSIIDKAKSKNKI